MCMGRLRLVGSFELSVSFAEYSLFHRALLQKRPIILRSLLIVATHCFTHANTHTHTQIYLSAIITLTCVFVCLFTCIWFFFLKKRCTVSHEWTNVWNHFTLHLLCKIVCMCVCTCVRAHLSVKICRKFTGLFTQFFDPQKYVHIYQCIQVHYLTLFITQICTYISTYTGALLTLSIHTNIFIYINVYRCTTSLYLFTQICTYISTYTGALPDRTRHMFGATVFWNFVANSWHITRLICEVSLISARNSSLQV